MENGSFEYHEVRGAPGLFSFTCWNEAHTGCGCFSVYSDRLAPNISALERSGTVNRTARKERFDYAKREWVAF